MTKIVGSGEYRYECVENWGRLPAGWSFKEIGAVGTDRNDNVYVFNRGEHPMIVFDKDGNFLKSWGEGVFPRAHGICVDSRGDIYVGEVSWTNWPTTFPDDPRPDSPRCLQKFRKI